MAMSLPLQVAISNSAHTAAVAISRNNTTNSHTEQLQSVCETCGQMLQTTAQYTDGDMLEAIIFGVIITILIQKFILNL